MSDVYLDQPRLALLRRYGWQRPPAGERRHGGSCGGELRSRHDQVELGQLTGVAGDISPGQRPWGVLCVMLKEDDARGYSRLRCPARLCGYGLTFSKGVCLACQPFIFPILAGRQVWFEGLSEPLLSVPCRVPESL